MNIVIRTFNQMTKEEILDYLQNYAKQNPAKYEAKKTELFARYGLNIEDEKPEEINQNVDELETIKKKITKKVK